MLESAGDDLGSVADGFWDAVGANLREGKIRLVFVADEIPAPLQRLVEFLNEQMLRVEVLALEISRASAEKSATYPFKIGRRAVPHREIRCSRPGLLVYEPRHLPSGGSQPA